MSSGKQKKGNKDKDVLMKNANYTTNVICLVLIPYYLMTLWKNAMHIVNKFWTNTISPAIDERINTKRQIAML